VSQVALLVYLFTVARDSGRLLCFSRAIYLFFRPPIFRRPWADFRETLPHTLYILKLSISCIRQYQRLSTVSIARSAKRRYLSYSESEANFEVFRPAEATLCTDGGEIWHGGGDRAKFHPHRCNGKGIGPQT